MSEQTWHRCDFPDCGKVASWKITRPPKPTTEVGQLEWAMNQQFQIQRPLMDEWCQEHGLALVTDRDAFMASFKALT